MCFGVEPAHPAASRTRSIERSPRSRCARHACAWQVLVLLAALQGCKAAPRAGQPPPGVPSSVARAAPASSSPADVPALRGLRHFVTRSGAVVILNDQAVDERGRFDLLVHFHGVHTALKPALEQARLNAVVLVIDAGLQTSDYSARMEFPGSLELLLAGLRRQLSERLGRPCVERRLALSAWSAGFAAVAQVLRHPAERQRVDGLLLADALHAAFIEPARRRPSPEQLAPFAQFAEQARGGTRLFALTHSEVGTPNYASTTETANALAERLGLPWGPVDAGGAEEPHQVRRIDQGDLHLWGYSGVDKHAHALQQRALGRTLLPLLRDWWARHPVAAAQLKMTESPTAIR